LKPSRCLRSGIAATHLRIETAESGVVRTFPAVRALLEEAQLPEVVRTRSIAAFEALARVGGAVCTDATSTRFTSMNCPARHR